MKLLIEPRGVRANSRLQIGFERTLRLPDDGKTYPLPPGLGALPVRRVMDYAERAPAAWRAGGPNDLFLPLHDREALFLVFAGTEGQPCAVQVGVGGINAVSGQAWNETLQADPQDYLVCPPQPWLDGINAGAGMVRQFVAVPLGQGYTVEGQLTGQEALGGIQILIWDAKPGRFPDSPPESVGEKTIESTAVGLESLVLETPGVMGLGAGGQMRQKIYPDPHGIETWESAPAASLRVHLVRARDWAALTGEEPPPTPVSAALYTAYGLPWFALEDADWGDVAAASSLARVKSIQELEREKTGRCGADLDGTSLALPDQQIVTLELSRQSGVASELDTTQPEEKSHEKPESNR